MAYPKMGEITDKFVGQPYDLNSVLSPSQVWSKLDAQSEEVRVFTNSLIDLLNSTGEDNWLYVTIVNAILGQITDGSLPDVKLSNDAGQIKDRLTSFVATSDAFVATKGQASGLASLDSGGNPVEKSFVSGTYTGNGEASRLIDLGFTPSSVLVFRNTGTTASSGATQEIYGGLATPGVAAVATGPATALSVETNGFNVYTSGYAKTNASSYVYTYMALR